MFSLIIHLGQSGTRAVSERFTPRQVAKVDFSIDQWIVCFGLDNSGNFVSTNNESSLSTLSSKSATIAAYSIPELTPVIIRSE